MSQEDLRHISRVDRQRGHSARHAASTVEQKLFGARQNERTDTVSLGAERRPAGRSQQNYREIGLALGQLLRLNGSAQGNQQQKPQECILHTSPQGKYRTLQRTTPKNFGLAAGHSSR